MDSDTLTEIVTRLQDYVAALQNGDEEKASAAYAGPPEALHLFVEVKEAHEAGSESFGWYQNNYQGSCLEGKYIPEPRGGTMWLRGLVWKAAESRLTLQETVMGVQQRMKR